MKILVVDDEPELREVICLGLQNSGWTTVEASGGKEAEAILKNEKFDAILSDIRMPQGNGIELLTFTRENINLTIPFILMTGYYDITQKEALDKGANYLLSKPFDLDDLILKLKNAHDLTRL